MNHLTNSEIQQETDSAGNVIAVTVGNRRMFRTGRRPYHSRVRFAAVRTGATGAWVYTIAAATERKAFNYKQGDGSSPEGIDTTATAADTNLISDARQTNDGELVIVRGLGIEILPPTDPALLRAAVPELSVSIDRGGGYRRDYLGSITDWPAGRGLLGLAPSGMVANPIAGGAPLVGAVSNGAPTVLNLRELPDPVIWTPHGQGFGTMTVNVKAERAIVVNSEAQTRIEAAGVHSFTPTADGAGRLDLRVHLIGEIFSEQAGG